MTMGCTRRHFNALSALVLAALVLLTGCLAPEITPQEFAFNNADEKSLATAAKDAEAAVADTSATGEDAGAAVADAGATANDTATVNDAGPAAQDVGAAVTDAGATGEDAGPLVQDAGATSEDAGPLVQDAGATANDTGSGPQDTAVAAPSGPCQVIAAGTDHTCAIKSDGTVACWGANKYGQLGDGTNQSSSKPVGVQGLTGAKAVVATSKHTCALKSDGTVVCWGHNKFGQLGNGNNDNKSTPVQVKGLTGVTDIGAGNLYSCALKSNGTVQCWGFNGWGQLGTGPSAGSANSSTPVDVVGLKDVKSISTGDYHVCAVKTGGTVACWGNNGFGQVGDGTQTLQKSPVAVKGLGMAVTAVSAGKNHSCALNNDSTVVCWGANKYGQVGNANNLDQLAPTAVKGLKDVLLINAGDDYSCALTDDPAAGSTIRCWGKNQYGQLGNGDTVDKNAPVTVTVGGGVGLTKSLKATFVTLGSSHTCALTAPSGSVRCWGSNFAGELGHSPSASAVKPTLVKDLKATVCSGG